MAYQSKCIWFLLGLQASPTGAWVISGSSRENSLSRGGQPTLQAAPTNDVDTVAATSSRRGFFTRASIAVATAAAAPLIAWADDDAVPESFKYAGDDDSASPLEETNELIVELEKDEKKDKVKEQKLVAEEKSSAASEEIKKVEEETKELIAELEKDEKDAVKEEAGEQELMIRLEEQQESETGPEPKMAQEKDTKELIAQLEKAQEKVEEEITQLVQLIEQVEADAEKAQVPLLPEPSETNEFVDRLKARTEANEKYLAELKEQMKPNVDTDKKGLLDFLKSRTKGNEEFRENYEWFLARMKSRFGSS